MGYTLKYKRSAIKGLRKIPRPIRETIVEKLESIALDPSFTAINEKCFDVIQLSGEQNLYRLRQGSYRAVYLKADDQLIVLVIRVEPRGGVYE